MYIPALSFQRQLSVVWNVMHECEYESVYDQTIVVYRFAQALQAVSGMLKCGFASIP